MPKWDGMSGRTGAEEGQERTLLFASGLGFQKEPAELVGSQAAGALAWVELGEGGHLWP